MEENKYLFDPLKHGFEPIKLFPELETFYPLRDRYVKIISYKSYGGLVYWYLVISENVGLHPDDRLKISSGSYDFRKPNNYNEQDKCITKYLGLISNDDFAENLLKHLMGTTKNDSINTISVERYKENLGVKMREEFPQHYKNNMRKIKLNTIK